jgi:uncharacterized protein
MSTATTKEHVEKHVQAQGSTFIWHQIYAPSDQKSIDFYTKAFGWGRTDYDMGPEGSYKMFTNQGTGIAGIISTDNSTDLEVKGLPPHWSITIGVEDVDETIKACESLGGKVVSGPFDVPDIGRMAVIQDPQGVAFWIMKPAPMP